MDREAVIKSGIKLTILVLILLVFPFFVYAGENDENGDGYSDKHELSIDYEYTSSKEYLKYYSCVYRLSLARTYKGTGAVTLGGNWDFTLNVNKETGEIKDLKVKQSSTLNDFMSTRSIDKIEVENKISIKNRYNSEDGYKCPSLMAKLTEKQKKDKNGNTLNVAKFTVEDADKSKYESKETTWYRYFKLYHIGKKGYYCPSYKDERRCTNDKYCRWGLTDSKKNEFGCIEKEYNSTSESVDSNERVEACTGYSEVGDFKNVEYSFTASKELNVTYVSIIDNYGQDSYIDENGNLYKLWKEGSCCKPNRFVIKPNLSTSDDAYDYIVSCLASPDGTIEGTGGTNVTTGTVGENPNISITPGKLQCQQLLGNPKNQGTPAYYILLVSKVLRYVAIVLLLVITTMDFIGAVSSQDHEILKKTVSKAIIRAILCVIIFLLPTFIDFILQFINDSSLKDCLM